MYTLKTPSKIPENICSEIFNNSSVSSSFLQPDYFIKEEVFSLEVSIIFKFSKRAMINIMGVYICKVLSETF